MRVALLVHGWPPEQVGGTELSTRRLARELVARGHDVLVIAGTLQFSHPPAVRRQREIEPSTGRAFLVAHVERSDPYFDHWQKHRAPRSGRAVEELLREHGAEVLHVHHWVRSTSDVVRRAARAGIPTLVSLHDHATTCLLGWRVHPTERKACTRPFDALGCATCAANVPPRTPWLDAHQQAVAAGQRQAELAAELRAAARVLVPSLSHGEQLLRLGLPPVHLVAVPPLTPVALEPSLPLAGPGPGEPLRVGAWGLSDAAKGTALLRSAAAQLGSKVHLVLAGLAAGEPTENIEVHGVYAPEDLQEHPVTKVHVAVSATTALESYGLVASEAIALGLPLVLPLAGAFEERFSDGEGVLFHAQGDAADLTRVLGRLAQERGLVDVLRRHLPAPDSSEPQVIEHLLDLYARAVRQGPPDVPAPDWFAERMEQAAMDAWDEEVKRRRPEDLGLSSEGGGG